MRKEQVVNRKEQVIRERHAIATDDICPDCDEEFALVAGEDRIEIECRCGCALAVV